MSAPARAVRRFYLELVRYRRQGGGTLPVEALLRRGLLDAARTLGEAAARSGTEVRVAALVELTTHDERAAEAIVAAGRSMWDSGVILDVWPQVPDDETRWLNTSTVADVHQRLARLLDEVDARGRPPGLGLCLDVEPPLSLLRAAQGSLGRRGVRERARHAGQLMSALTRNVRMGHAGKRAFLSLQADLERRGLPVHVAVLPSVVTPSLGAPVRRWLLGAPLLDDDGAALLGRPAPMCYASLLRPLARGRRDVERALLRRAASQHARHFLARRAEPLAVALGVISQGVLGDEPVYEDLRHLVEDLEDVRALGFEDVAFFSLEGLLFGAPGMPDDESFMPSRAAWSAWAPALLG